MAIVIEWNENEKDIELSSINDSFQASFDFDLIEIEHKFMTWMMSTHTEKHTVETMVS